MEDKVKAAVITFITLAALLIFKQTAGPYLIQAGILRPETVALIVVIFAFVIAGMALNIFLPEVYVFLILVIVLMGFLQYHGYINVLPPMPKFPL